MKPYLIFLFLSIAIVSCNKEVRDTDDSSTEIILTSSSSAFREAVANRSSEKSDPFVLRDVIFTGDTVKITVSYSGGCKRHSFEIIWDETLSDTEPQQTGLIILHNGNGDSCEAYITETLAFNISDLAGNLTLNNLYVSVLNGYDPADSTSSGGWNPADSTSYDDGSYKIVFTESDYCIVKVTASNVICGTGLYNNLWFALQDSISAGIEGYYFRKYLQPVAIDKSISDFVPVQDKKYLVGAKIQKDHDYLGVPVCLAYSGPSVPVRIMCIKEIK